MTFGKLVGISINVSAKVKETLDRQARARGIASSPWASQCFDMGFAAVCARDKGMTVADADLDAICGATLLLKFGKGWKPDEIAKGLGVSVDTVKRILDGWNQLARCGRGAK